ncbi:unnamed protein product [Effrenium voratum]|nr:unnamed protein product [Effrenium voratum]|mmetsp:Transcript_26797/g.63819  ORF Transcript_26797/g.63819 Transcript_26797/m.63819 type:complete len:215 (+) Transcript_26797:128-772(+)
MLIPMSADPSGPVPEVVKTVHVYGWYVIIFLLSFLSVGECIAGDAFAGIIFSIMAGIVVFLLVDGCKNMSMYCLFMLGTMSSFQCFFDLLGLISVVGGRETSESTMQGTDKDVTVITRITVHPFFDPKMGQQYNAQSSMMVASPGIMLACTFMCYLSYNAFSDSLFDVEEEAGPLFNYRGGGPGGNSLAYGANQPSPRPTAPRIFEGAGHRLSG